MIVFVIAGLSLSLPFSMGQYICFQISWRLVTGFSLKVNSETFPGRDSSEQTPPDCPGLSSSAEKMSLGQSGFGACFLFLEQVE